MNLNVTQELRSGILVLRLLEPRLDSAKAPMLRDELLRRIEEGQSRIVLDLSSTEFMDSSGLGALVAGLKRLGSRGGLSVVGAQAECPAPGPPREGLSRCRLCLASWEGFARCRSDDAPSWRAS
jgi:anti-sigma B factor antagonist